MPRVYVANKSSHDFSAAERFGELEFLTEGVVSKFSVADIDRQIRYRLRLSSPNDYILITGMSIVSALACVCFAMKHNKLNLLIYTDKRYIERNLNYNYQRTNRKQREKTDDVR
jgi:hypothetical protein